jgi:Universal stress protein family
MMFADPVAALVELSSNVEMIIVGSRDRSALRPALFGSVSSALVHRSQCPVAVIHDEDPLRPPPAQAPGLLGVGSSTASDRATRRAGEEALRRGVELVATDQSASHLVEQFKSAPPRRRT